MFPNLGRNTSLLPDHDEFLPRDAMLARYMPWPSVRLCPSVTSRSSIETEALRAGFGVGASFCLTDKEIRERAKILHSGTLRQTLDLGNFATASRSCCEQNSFDRACGSYLRQSTRRCMDAHRGLHREAEKRTNFLLCASLLILDRNW